MEFCFRFLSALTSKKLNCCDNTHSNFPKTFFQKSDLKNYAGKINFKGKELSLWHKLLLYNPYIPMSTQCRRPWIFETTNFCRGSNMVSSTKNCNQRFEIWTELNWNRFLSNQLRGLNSLKELSFCHKLWFSNFYNLTTRFPRP